MPTLDDIIVVAFGVALFTALTALVHFSGIMRPGAGLF
jgi:hypothetical protein